MTLHFELGRAVVGQLRQPYQQSDLCKTKEPTNSSPILDAGMTDLIRPALYQAYHKMKISLRKNLWENLRCGGPICESSDVFGRLMI